MARTIFERYGGFAQVSRVVSSFYDRVLDSPLTRPYFEGTDMRRLIDHQTKFLSFLMGGPASYTHDHIERVHARLGITDAAFVEVVTLLKETLGDFEFAAEDIRAIEDALGGFKHLIVNRA
jgi:hemoglobin